MDKKYFQEKLSKVGLIQGTYKMRFIKKGKYGDPECWIYPLNFKKKIEKFTDMLTGKTKRFETYGLLITKETLEDSRYLKDYIENCFVKLAKTKSIEI